VQSIRTARILFLGEQDGAIERELKAELSNCLVAEGCVSSAYLAQVSYRDAPGQHVALCLRGQGPDAARLIARIEAIFRRRFNATQHLDIVFLSKAQMSEIKRVATPFYSG
jgi:hypothetical protein